jgi:hypothetical protein
MKLDFLNFGSDPFQDWEIVSFEKEMVICEDKSGFAKCDAARYPPNACEN